MTVPDKIVKKFAIDTDACDFEVKHYVDGSVMISQTGGFDGREHIFIPAGMYAFFVEAMKRPEGT